MTLSVALQEWSSICDLLGDGRLILAVRKGGIHERHGGLFALEHERFALLPTALHQDAARLKPAFAGAVRPASGTGTQHHIALWAEAARIWKVGDRRTLDRIAGELAWSDAELDARFAYRGQPFLYVVALRVFRLPQTVVIPDHPSYAGCRSWIPLRDTIATAGSQAVVADGAWQSRLSPVASSLQHPASASQPQP